MKYRGGDPDALHDAMMSGDRPDLARRHLGRDIRPTDEPARCGFVLWLVDGEPECGAPATNAGRCARHQRRPAIGP
jgi:hypothetical protein